MSNTIEKSIQRLFWRFGNGKFEPNQNDLDAVTFIANWVNREKQERINRNRYFGKVVVYAYLNELRFYGDKHLSERKIQEVLEKPLTFWYSMFKDELNRIELNQAFESVGVLDSWQEAKDENGYFNIDKVKDLQDQNRLNIAENENNIVKSIMNPRTQKEVTNRLNIFITELLNKYGNLE